MLIVEAANAQARWTAIDEQYEHTRALLLFDLLPKIPAQFTTSFAQEVWLDGQLHQNPQYEAIRKQLTAARRDCYLQQARVDASKLTFDVPDVQPEQSVGGDSFKDSSAGPPTISPMDKPVSGGGSYSSRT